MTASRYTSYNSYAQLHAKGEFEENGHKVHSLIGISIQDYSSGTGDKNIITRFPSGTRTNSISAVQSCRWLS